MRVQRDFTFPPVGSIGGRLGVGVGVLATGRVRLCIASVGGRWLAPVRAWRALETDGQTDRQTCTQTRRAAHSGQGHAVSVCGPSLVCVRCVCNRKQVNCCRVLHRRKLFRAAPAGELRRPPQASTEAASAASSAAHTLLCGLDSIGGVRLTLLVGRCSSLHCLYFSRSSSQSRSCSSSSSCAIDLAGAKEWLVVVNTVTEWS